MFTLPLPVLSVYLHLLAVLISNYNTPLLIAWVVDPCLRDLYIEYSSSITTSFPINLFFLFLTYSKTSWTITSSYAMGTGFHSSSWNMDHLLMTLFQRDTINNTTHFLTSVPESVVETTWTTLRWVSGTSSPVAFVKYWPNRGIPIWHHGKQWHHGTCLTHGITDDRLSS